MDIKITCADCGRHIGTFVRLGKAVDTEIKIHACYHKDTYDHIKEQTEKIKEHEDERDAPPEDILICKCGWWGSVAQQDVAGSECGCCPHCGNEALFWLSKLQEQIKELEDELTRLRNIINAKRR